MTKPHEGPSAATRLARIAQERYTFGVSIEGEPYALPLDGPRIVKMLRGAGSLRAELAAAFLVDFGNPAPQQALTDALMAIEGIALAAKAKPLALRVAQSHGALWLDLGDDTGELVRITPEGWQIVSEAPVLHRRTALTAPLPTPASDGDLSALWSLLNIAAPDRPVLVAFLVAALMPNMPHPILLLTGEQGTGKSTAAKIIASVVDASTVQLRKPPRDLDSWTTAAVGSHVVAVDNLSTLPDWLSDALCRASTGDGDVRRRLYTDGDLHVISFRRVVILNGIDLGAVRDDLADRLVTVDLHRIEESARARDDDLTQRWQAAAPLILGGLLDLTARVLAILPSVHLERSPRMADFAHVLAAVDRLEGTEGLARYRELAGALASDAVTSDPVLIALTSTISNPWEGVALDLLTAVTATLGDARPPKGWPSGARALTTLLKRRAPSLRRLGWTVEQTDRRTKQGPLWTIEPPISSGAEPSAETVLNGNPAPAQHHVQHPSAPALTCEDTETGRIGAEVLRNPSNLSVVTEQRERPREVPDSSASQHSVTDCLACGEPLAADLIADDIRRHIGCAS
jgi:hypothetical protein